MSRFAGLSCKSILYCSPEQPPPMTATRSTPVGRPCFVSSDETFFAALSVSFIKRSSPTRKFGVVVVLFVAAAAIMIERLLHSIVSPSERQQTHLQRALESPY